MKARTQSDHPAAILERDAAVAVRVALGTAGSRRTWTSWPAIRHGADHLIDGFLDDRRAVDEAIPSGINISPMNTAWSATAADRALARRRRTHRPATGPARPRAAMGAARNRSAVSRETRPEESPPTVSTASSRRSASTGMSPRAVRMRVPDAIVMVLPSRPLARSLRDPLRGRARWPRGNLLARSGVPQARCRGVIQRRRQGRASERGGGDAKAGDGGTGPKGGARLGRRRMPRGAS